MAEVPVIDVSALFGAGAAPELDRQIARALQTEAGFVVVGSPLAEGLGARMDGLKAVFDLPQAERLQFAIQKRQAGNVNLYRGYTPPPERSHFAYNETFDVGPEPPLSAPDLPSKRAFEEANVWPAEAALPGWRAAALDYVEGCRALSGALLRAAARGVGLNEDAFGGFTQGRNYTLRLLHYPEVPEGFELLEADGSKPQTAPEGQRAIAREHIDTGVLSVLWQDQQGGLQMRGRDGVWREVPVVAGAVSVHCGDLLAPIAGESMAATPHRVIGGLAERFSAGFFLEPDWLTEVTPPDGTEPKTYAAHLTDEFPDRFLAQS